MEQARCLSCGRGCQRLIFAQVGGGSTTGMSNNGRQAALRGESSVICPVEDHIAPLSSPREWRSSVGQDVFVIGGWIYVVTRLIAVGRWQIVGGGVAGGSCQRPRWRRIFSATRESSMTAMTRMGSDRPGSAKGPRARRGGSAFAEATAGEVRSRQRLQGSFSGGGGETPGRRTSSSGDRPRWRTPRILFEYQP